MGSGAPRVEQLPHNDEAERVLLGALLVDNDQIPAVIRAGLRSEDFYRLGHQHVFRAVLDLHDLGRPADLVTLKNLLAERGLLDSIGIALVAGLVDGVPRSTNALHYARIVQEKALRRAAAQTSSRLLHRLLTEDLAPEEALADLDSIRARIEAAAGTRTRLPIRDIAEVLERVARTEPSWLIQGIWPSDAYGILAAEDKAGKTFAGLDLAASVAGGVPWLGRFPCPQGRVVAFIGEGGERNASRRLKAIAASKGLDLGRLPLRICERVPSLTDPADLAEVRAELAATRPRAVLLDPLYLAAAGLKGSDLYAMGSALYGIQRVCQDAKVALVVVTHWNKTGAGDGPQRISGVGPGAWGRVLVSMSVEQRSRDKTGASDVLLKMHLRGGEIPDMEFRIRRRVRSLDPADLGSPLEYSVETTEVRDEPEGESGSGLSRTQERVLAALAEEPASVRVIGDRVASDGKGMPLKRRTIQDALGVLEKRGLAAGTEADGVGQERTWSRASVPLKAVPSIERRAA